MNRKMDLFRWFKERNLKQEGMNNEEVLYLIEKVLKDDIEKINSGELNEEERKKTVDEVLKLSDKYNSMVSNEIEKEKVNKQPGRKFVKIIETVRAGTGITTTVINLVWFNNAFNKVGMLEETGKWTTTAFRKLPWPKIK